MGLATIGFADALAKLQPDVLVILGDRFEALAIAQTALIMRIPIAHIHGGELTYGAYDDAIRHAITKMSFVHFTAAEPYRQRVLQMGEEKQNVFNVGALGLEQVRRCQPCFEKLKEALLNVLSDWPSHHVLFTYPNADNGGHKIIAGIEAYCQQHPHRAFAFKALGIEYYSNAIQYAEVVLGNSSSGVIEVPSFGKPTVNIGRRQEGRLSAESVIHTESAESAIRAALRKALSAEFRDRYALN